MIHILHNVFYKKSSYDESNPKLLFTRKQGRYGGLLFCMWPRKLATPCRCSLSVSLCRCSDILTEELLLLHLTTAFVVNCMLVLFYLLLLLKPSCDSSNAFLFYLCSQGVTRYSIKDRFGLFGKVKYVDYNDGDESGIAFVRFDVPADAASALASLGESGWNFNDATPTSAEETGASAAADGSTTAVAAEESADSAGAAETSRDSCAAAVAVSLLAGDEEEAYWANIDAMHRQKQAQGGGKGGKGGGKGKGKGKGGKGKGRRS